MPHRQPVQLITTVGPPRQMLIQQRDEAGVVRWFQQVQQFMDQNIFQAQGRLLRQLSIEANGVSGVVATYCWPLIYCSFFIAPPSRPGE